MNKILRRWQLLMIVFLVVLGAGLRMWKYEYFPIAGETQDEVAWTILGSSLLQTGEPVSWSYFSGYTILETVTFQHNSFQLVKPALDHPPLFSFLPGIVQTVTGHHWKEIPSIKLVRFPLVLLGMLNLGLFTWWIMRITQNPVQRIASIALAATAPNIVFLSRLVVSENLLVTWILLILLLQSTALKGWHKWMWMLVHVAAPMTKISGLAICAGSIAASWYTNNKVALKWALLGTGGGIILLLGYVSLFDFGLFWQVQTQQAARNTGLLTLFSTWWWANTLVEGIFADVWNQVGLFSLGLLAFFGLPTAKEKRSEKSLILFLFFAQLAFYLLSVGETTVHGWYRIVFWPLWVYSLGWVVARAWEEKSAWWLSFSWLLMSAQVRLGWVFLLGKTAFEYQGMANKIWLLGAGLGLSTLFLPKKWQSMTQKQLWIILGCIVLLAHLAAVLTIQHELFWQDALYLEQGIQP